MQPKDSALTEKYLIPVGLIAFTTILSNFKGDGGNMTPLNFSKADLKLKL